MIQRKKLMVSKICADNIKVEPVRGEEWKHNKEQFITREKLYELLKKEDADEYGRVLSFYKFHLFKDGSGWVDSKYFDSIESLLSENYNRLSPKEQFTEVDAFMSSLSLMTPDNKTLFRCGDYKGEYVYCIVEYDEQKWEKKITVYIPYTTVRIPRKSLKDVYKEHRLLQCIKVVGGGPYLTKLGGLFENCSTKQLDTSELEVATWVDTQNTFNGSYIENIDLSFLKGKRIEKAMSMFKGIKGMQYLGNGQYRETKIQLNMDELDFTECINTDAMFDDAKIILSGSLSDTGNVLSMDDMFASCKGEIWEVTKTLNMSKVVEANRMFCEASVDGVGPLNSKGIDALRSAMDMFCETIVISENGRIDISGIKPDNLETVYNMFSAYSIKAIVGVEPINDPAKRRDAYGNRLDI